MNPRVAHVGDVAVVTPEGMLLGGAETVALEAAVRQLLDGGQRKVLLDLRRTQHLSSNPIGVLIGLQVSAQGRGAAFHVCNADKKIRNVLSLLRVVEVLRVFDTTEEAMRAFAALGPPPPRAVPPGSSGRGGEGLRPVP